MTERRFNEDEVAAIFERATQAHDTGQHQLASRDGMTLAQLQEIGREIGIAPEVIAQSAQVIEQGGQPTSRSFLGLPLGVGRTVELERRLTEDEWERLVVDLRETFDARGTVKHEGSLRQWTNGNLQALLEPTASGHRVRLRTFKADARGLMIAGLSTVGVTMTLIGSALVVGGVDDPGMFGSLSFLAAIGVAMFASAALRLPAWARTRRAQMEAIAERLVIAAKSRSSDWTSLPGDRSRDP